MNLLVSIIFGSFSLGSVFVKANPIVEIKNGTLEGIYLKSKNGREFAAFMGIPYAFPPLGDLRFEPPRPAASWSEVRTAKDIMKMCTQRDVFSHQNEILGDEDCLYLNVFTPQLKISKEESKHHKLYPVMIWIHGGGFLAGAAIFSGPKFLLDHEVVLVTVNYRLGPLGFLSTEDLVIPGNQGFKDQSQAIRWVHENIVEFGGDPNRVTLFGESAGGASSHYHMISPLSKGLFHRGISQSGTANCRWGLSMPGMAKKNAEKLGQLLDCPTSHSRELLNCLKTKNHIDIIATDRAFQVFDYCPAIPFRPVIEPDHPGAFLTEHPAISLKNGRMADVPWIAGVTSHEGSLRVAALYGLFNGELLKQLNDDFETIAPLSLLYREMCSKNSIENITKSIREFYLHDKPLDESSRFDLIDLYTDAWFFIAFDNAVRSQYEVLSSPVYSYYFSYRGSSSFSKIFGDETRDYGVTHADELQYLFPIGEILFKDVLSSDNDQKMIDVMTNLWFNFANSGNPTPEITPEIPVKWKPVRTNSLEFLHIKNPNEIFMDKNLWSDRVQFWKNFPCFNEASVLSENQVLRDEL